ncbi:MAG: hypothetical protein ACRD9R_07135 [Pyrinomonadaceae bacterium]
MSANASTLSAVTVGAKKCKPFLLEVMVMAPEAGFKFEVMVEKGCTAQNDAVWKLVFDLYKKIEGEFVQIVHVSFKAGDADETNGVKKMAREGVTPKAAEVISTEVHPVAKRLETEEPTPALKKELKAKMKKAVIVELED